MPVSGLVVTVSEPASKTAARLSQHPAVTCGVPTANRLPVVIDADDDQASRAAHAWIESQPGVVLADVVYVAFDDEKTPPPSTLHTCAARNAP